MSRNASTKNKPGWQAGSIELSKGNEMDGPSKITTAPIIVHIVENGLITWIGTMQHVEPTRRSLLSCMKEVSPC